MYSETHIISEQHDWIVFVHGAGGNISTWKYQVPHFKKNYNVLLFDLKGHGKSKSQDSEMPYTFESIAEDINSLLLKHNIPNAIFMGLSIGSLIIHSFYEKYPEKVKCIIGSGGIYKITNKIHLFTTFAHILVRVFPFHFLYRFFALIVMPKANHKTSRKIFNQASSKIEQREYIRWLNLYSSFRSTVNKLDFNKVEVPILVVMGAEDHLFLNAAREFCEAVKEAELIVIPKCGHIASIEKTDEFNRIVDGFLREHDLHYVNTKTVSS